MYSDRGWSRLRVTALMLQRTDKGTVEDAIEEFVRETAHRSDYLEQWSKVFLLLRVMFALPEAAPPSDARIFGGWLAPYRGAGTSAKVNLAWPIQWNNQRPRLVARYSGYEGAAYLAWLEYSYFLNKYKFRDLTATGQQYDH